MSEFFQTLKQQTLAAQQTMLQAPIFAQCAKGDIDR